MSEIGFSDWLAARLTALAAVRLRGRYPEWADAMANEQASVAGERGQLGWSTGLLRASFMIHVPDVFYLVALCLALLSMVLYQWSADEGLMTVLVLAGLGLWIGFLRPSRFLTSGFAVGAVVAAVNGFETFSGLRPAYETHAHTLAQDLLWLVFIPPALLFSALGRQVGLKLSA